MFLILSLSLLLQATTASETAPKFVTQTEMNASIAAQKLELEKLRVALEDQIKELDFKQREGDSALEKRILPWEVVVGILGLSVLGIFYKIITLDKWMKKWIDDRLEQKFDDHTRAINAMIDDRNLEDRLKKQMRMLLLNGDGNRRTLSQLQGWGFKKVWVKALEDYQTDPKPEDYDLIILDQLNQEQVEQIMQALPSRVLVSYTKQHFNRFDNQGRVNLANSPMTLLARVVEAAKFIELEKT